MCKIGDIIVIYNYIKDGEVMDKHSFVVIDDTPDQIQGIDYNLICNVMSSFQNEEHKQKKLKYLSNFPIKAEDSVVKNGNNREGYIKSDQFYYFKKESINFKVIGYLLPEVFNELIDLINSADIKIVQVIDNLQTAEQ